MDPVAIDYRNEGKAICNLGYIYSYFLQGVSVGAWSMGVRLTTGKEHGHTEVDLFIKMAYQFQRLMPETI